MTYRETALAAGGLMIGAALLSKAVRRQRAIDVDGRVALITGGSRGLGLLIARELGRRGCRVILVARDELELQRAQQDLRSQQVDVAIRVADVSREADAQRIVNEAVASHGRLDLLINNAGVITVGPFAHMGVADFEEAMATHFWGPLHAMRAAIPHMRHAGGGRIANISSVGGRIGVPHLVPYCASKFALTGLSTASRGELAGDNILVTTVCPGLMRTGSPFNAWFKGRHRQEFAWFAIADSLPLLSIDGGRAARRGPDRRRGPPWRCRARPLMAGAAGDCCRSDSARHRRTCREPCRSDAPLVNRRRRRSRPQRMAEFVRLGPVGPHAASERSAAHNNELPIVD